VVQRRSIFLSRTEKLEGEGGGEAVEVREFVVRAKFGGGAGEDEVGGDEGDGKLGDVFEDFAGEAGSFGAPDGVIDLAQLTTDMRSWRLPATAR
jgi:hypothetical protein